MNTFENEKIHAGITMETRKPSEVKREDSRSSTAVDTLSTTPSSPRTQHTTTSQESATSNTPLVNPFQSVYSRCMSYLKRDSTSDRKNTDQRTAPADLENQNQQSEVEEIDDDDSSDNESEESSRRRKPIVRQIHKLPRGYPTLAAFLDSDENFMLYRRFGYLQSRLLLEKQDDLARLEQKLERMDRIHNREDERNELLMTRDFYGTELLAERESLMHDIEKKWVEYSQLLQAAQHMTSFNKPTSGEYNSVCRWMENEEPVYDNESKWVCHHEDLVTLRPTREYISLDRAVEGLLRKCGPIQGLFRSKETREKTDGARGEVYFTRSRIDGLVTSIITIMILVLLVVPIYILYHLTEGNDDSAAVTIVGGSGIQQRASTSGANGNMACIGVLLVFTLAFSACMSLFTRARRHEILASAAAYCAVLVVFIGNLNVGNNGPSIARSLNGSVGLYRYTGYVVKH